MRLQLSLLTLFAATATSPIAAQALRRPLAVQVDTSDRAVRELAALAQGYLRSDGAGWTQTKFWQPAEQIGAPQYDPASGILGYQLPGTIVQITPDVPDDSTYVIKVLFAVGDSASARWQPLAVQRFYATRSGDAWVLTSALQRHTSDWTVKRRGRIRYYHSPQYQFREDLARSAVAFIDSITAALSLSPPDTIDYYLAPSADEMARLLGFDWLKLPSGPESGRGGWGGSGRVFSGDPRRGENYRHELAHILVGPLRSAKGRHRFVEEGFATWVGGSGGVFLSDGIRELEAFAQSHLAFPWQELTQFSTPEEIRNLSGARLFDAVYRAAGWSGVRSLLEAGRSAADLFAALPPSWQLTPSTFEAWWRSEIRQRASGQSSLP